jgi:probable F420-dependent oxidoreductase
MKFGFSVPISGPAASPAIMARLAQEGESIGYDYVTISDHVVEPTDIQARYPYSETGEFPKTSTGDRHEQLTAVAYLAAKTSKIQFLTSVMVVPHRPAVLAAKVLSTIDVLSGGRLMLGIGAGWMKEEFEALGLPPFADRGAVTDEYIEAFRELWTKDRPKMNGRFVKFSDIIFAPKPIQKPHPPIWVGGESGPAMRRTARLGDTWYPIGTNPQFRLNTLPRLRAGIAKMAELTEKAGRNPSAVTTAFRVQRYGASVPAKADDGDRQLFSGSMSDLAHDLQMMKGLGVSAVDFNVAAAGPGVDDIVAAMRELYATLKKV